MQEEFLTREEEPSESDETVEEKKKNFLRARLQGRWSDRRCVQSFHFIAFRFVSFRLPFLGFSFSCFVFSPSNDVEFV